MVIGKTFAISGTPFTANLHRHICKNILPYSTNRIKHLLQADSPGVSRFSCNALPRMLYWNEPEMMEGTL